MVGFRPFLVVFVSVKVSSLRWCTLNRCCLRSQSVVMVLMAFVILSPLLLVLFLSSVVFQPFFVDTPQNHYRYQSPPPPPPSLLLINWLMVNCPSFWDLFNASVVVMDGVYLVLFVFVVGEVNRLSHSLA